MTKKTSKSSDTANQITIFDLLKKAEEMSHGSAPHAAGCLSYRSELCHAMAEDIRHATDDRHQTLSRHDIAARINNLLNLDATQHPVTINTLNSWTAPSHHDYTPDAMELSAFVRATSGTGSPARRDPEDARTGPAAAARDRQTRDPTRGGRPMRSNTRPSWLDQRSFIHARHDRRKTSIHCELSWGVIAAVIIAALVIGWTL
jgi:hypothetical protein